MKRDERGGGTMLTLSVMILTCSAMLVGVWVAGWVGSIHRARAAADLASLAGAQAYAAGQDACSAARPAARRNGATLASCSLEGHPASFLVRVRVKTDLLPAWGGHRTTVAEAVAGTASGEQPPASGSGDP